MKTKPPQFIVPCDPKSEAERIVLGSLLVNLLKPSEMAKVMSASDFDCFEHQIMFETMCRIDREVGCPKRGDLMRRLSEALGAKYPGYLLCLFNYAAALEHPVNIWMYIDIVRNK